ncbi:unnamed protein product [Peronospora destructor]|uniref:HMG box domain-containing protein n=1 Tax=Peronospora destructor TaxID=86335 RepID=A0AAV0U6K8_9STRA|nr:unnamed protein product [Peronospora destructor]
MSKSEEKESRDVSDWVAVQAQFQNGEVGANQPVRPKSAYHFFQKHVIDAVKRELSVKAAQVNELMEIGSISKEISARWAQLSTGGREDFVKLATADKKRYDRRVSRAR